MIINCCIQAVCPTCGRCPTCGHRHGGYVLPWVAPPMPWPQPQPFWVRPDHTIYVNNPNINARAVEALAGKAR